MYFLCDRNDPISPSILCLFCEVRTLRSTNDQLIVNFCYFVFPVAAASDGGGDVHVLLFF